MMNIWNTGVQFYKFPLHAILTASTISICCVFIFIQFIIFSLYFFFDPWTILSVLVSKHLGIFESTFCYWVLMLFYVVREYTTFWRLNLRLIWWSRIVVCLDKYYMYIWKRCVFCYYWEDCSIIVSWLKLSDSGVLLYAYWFSLYLFYQLLTGGCWNTSL